MSISPARITAYRILLCVEAGRGFAVDLLQAKEVDTLNEADRRLATELVMGDLRWRGELDDQISQLSGRGIQRLDPEVVTILRMGVYQIRFLEKIPKSAAVNEAVEMTKAARKRSASGFVNAVLRKCKAAKRSCRLEGFDRAAVERARRVVPAWLLERWSTRFSAKDGADEDIALRLAYASLQVPPTVLRVANPVQDVALVRAELSAAGVRTSLGTFSPLALGVESGNVHASDALRVGRVVIQDEASQLVVQLLAPQPGNRVLDLCAAPGIKSGQIAQALGCGSLIACDRSVSRLHTMARLLPQWLPRDVQLHMVRLDAAQELPFAGHFDRILLDAPCSGTGTLVRNPEIKWRLRPADLKRLAVTQAKMLRGALSLLAPGGRLVYATCSLEPEEDEQVIEQVVGQASDFQVYRAQDLRRDFPAFSLLFDSNGYLRTRPDLHKMDGFFASVIVRNQP